MNKYAILLPVTWLAVLASSAAEPLVKLSVLDNSVLCVRASRVPDNVKDQIRAAALPSHLAGTVLDLRFADDAATNAADYFIHRKSPLVVLVNSRTRGPAATLATQLRSSAAALLIGSTNSPAELAPDILVAVSPDEEQRFQDNPFFVAANPLGMSATNLLAFVDHTSEAELVRKHIKDGEEDGSGPRPIPEPVAAYGNNEGAPDGSHANELASPHPETNHSVVRDPALARAMDLLKALAALHPARG